MCTVFRDTEGVVLTNYMPYKVTIIGDYCADLLHKKHVTVEEKCCDKLTQVSLLLHDSAPAHRSRVGQAAVFKCRFEKMHNILVKTHQVIAISFQIYRKISSG